MADTRKGSTMELDEEPTATGQGTRFKPATQEWESEVTIPTQLTCHGSAPEECWTELATLAEDIQDQLVLEEESFPQVQLLSPADLGLLQEIAEGSQANVFLATCSKFSTPAVVKRLKYGEVNLLRLQRRMDRVMRLVREHSSAMQCDGRRKGQGRQRVDPDGTHERRFAKSHRPWCALCGVCGRWADALCEAWGDAV